MRTFKIQLIVFKLCRSEFLNFILRACAPAVHAMCAKREYDDIDLCLLEMVRIYYNKAC